jgi:hypothetical protein
VSLTDNAFPSDQLDLTYTSASFNGKNVGSGKTVSVIGIDLSGADAGNYTYSSTAASTANITPATLVVGATGSTKDYDGTTAASVSLTDNAYAGDPVTLTHGPANFANPAVGNGKPISVSGIQIGGAAAGDYVLAETTATTTGDIVLDSAYTDALAMQGAWALPPALPQSSAFADTQPPASVLAPEADANTAVTVALVRPQTEQLPGLITVSVPQDMIASGRGFSFPLPAPVQESAATNKVQVTLTNGRRLPAWLRYMQSTRTFVVTGAPAGALPITVLMRIGEQRWTVQIATAS